MWPIDPPVKMRKPILLIIGLMMLSSCYTTHYKDQQPPPKNLIDKDKIVLILADIELAESALRQKLNHGYEVKEVRETYYRSIFNEYEISREQFDSSMTFYKQDLDGLNQIYEEVITRLSVIESEVEHEGI